MHKMQPLDAWVVVKRTGAIVGADGRANFHVFADEARAIFECGEVRGRRVVPVRIVPVEARDE